MPHYTAVMLGIWVDDEVFLRLHEERHAEELYRLTHENRSHLRQWLPWVDGTRSSDDTRQFIRMMLQRLAEGAEYGLGILYHDELVGAIGLSIEKQWREAEIGYWLSLKAQGHGIVSRATKGLVRFCFEDLAMNRVVILCAVDNSRSRAVPERLGFHLEGTLRERDVIPDRDPRDQVIYSLLRSDWEASKR
jgi:ribosomal-protein-serine acetyltransferase